jgi:hypothetical protein
MTPETMLSRRLTMPNLSRPVAMTLALCLGAPAWAQEAPTAEPAAPAPAVAPTPKAAPTVNEAAVADHRGQLLKFQERIDVLAKRVDRAEARVGALRTSALSGTVVRTRAIISHKNEAGSGFTMERATYILDGQTILDRENTDGRLDEAEPLQLFSGPIGPGDHELRVAVRVRGQAYGPFTYLEGYKFNIQSRYVFQVVEGQLNRLDIVTTQKGDITVEPQDRLTVRYDASLVDPTKTPAAP